MQASSISFSGYSILWRMMVLLFSILEEDELGVAEVILCDIYRGFLVDIVDVISEPSLLFAIALFKKLAAAEFVLFDLIF